MNRRQVGPLPILGTLRQAENAAGDIARQAAAAPRPNRAQPEAPKAEPKKTENPLDKIFTGYVFKAPPRAQTFEREGDGAMTLKIANVLVEVQGAFYLRGGVKVIKPKRGKQYGEFTFFSTQHQGAVVFEDAKMREHFATWKKQLLTDCKKWREETGQSAEVPSDVVEMDDITMPEIEKGTDD